MKTETHCFLVESESVGISSLVLVMVTQDLNFIDRFTMKVGMRMSELNRVALEASGKQSKGTVASAAWADSGLSRDRGGIL